MAKQQAPQHTQQQLEHAAGDAKYMLENSAIVTQAYASMVTALRLWNISRSVLNSELTGGYDLSFPELTTEALVHSAKTVAMQNYTNVEVLDQLNNNTVPFMRIVALNELAVNKKPKQKGKKKSDVQPEHPASPDPGPANSST